MRVLVALACLLACCLAQAPHPCRTPIFLSGSLSVSSQNEKVFAYGKYEYDAVGRRLRLGEMGTYENKTFTYDVLLNYREGVMYEIDDKARKCTRKPLKGAFHPWEIPQGSSLLAQVILGSSSGPGEGLLVNTWMGNVPEENIKFISTVTEFACIPVSSVVHTDEFGWMVTSLFNNVIGIVEPGALNPPSFCTGEGVKTEEKPESIFSMFRKMH